MKGISNIYIVTEDDRMSLHKRLVRTIGRLE